MVAAKVCWPILPLPTPLCGLGLRIERCWPILPLSKLPCTGSGLVLRIIDGEPVRSPITCIPPSRDRCGNCTSLPPRGDLSVFAIQAQFGTQ